MEILQSENMQRDSNFRMLLYAKPGAGKTSTVRYLQGETLLLDVDHTSQVLSGLPGISIMRINPENPIQDMIDFYGYAKAHINEFDNIFIDNLTHYQKLWLMQKGKKTKSGQPELKDYGIFDNHILDMIATFNNLDANVVYTSWESTRQIQLESGQLYNQFLPDIREKIVNHVMGIIPVVGRLIKNPETGQRGFILTESNGTFSKNQLDNRKHAVQEEIFSIGDENGV